MSSIPTRNVHSFGVEPLYCIIILYKLANELTIIRPVAQVFDGWILVTEGRILPIKLPKYSAPTWHGLRKDMQHWQSIAYKLHKNLASMSDF